MRYTLQLYTNECWNQFNDPAILQSMRAAGMNPPELVKGFATTGATDLFEDEGDSDRIGVGGELDIGALMRDGQPLLSGENKYPHWEAFLAIAPNGPMKECARDIFENDLFGHQRECVDANLRDGRDGEFRDRVILLNELFCGTGKTWILMFKVKREIFSETGGEFFFLCTECWGVTSQDVKDRSRQ